MTRVIKDLSLDTYRKVSKDNPRIFTDYSLNEAGNADVILNEASVLKSYDDFIVLDLGGTLSFISPADFSEIVLT